MGASSRWSQFSWNSNHVQRARRKDVGVPRRTQSTREGGEPGCCGGRWVRQR